MTQTHSRVEPPEEALCLGCNYALRGLPESRCPECGRAFDLGDPETMHLPVWPRFLGVRALRRPGWVLYLWPVVAAVTTYVLGQWPNSDHFSMGYYPGADVPLPRWTGIAHRHIGLWPHVVWMWVLLLAAWYIRTRLRREAVIRYRLAPHFLRRDDRLRRFSCACFLLAAIFGGYHTDRCTHGEYWQWWQMIGIVRNLQGDFAKEHGLPHIPIGDGWSIYFGGPWYRQG